MDGLFPDDRAATIAILAQGQVPAPELANGVFELKLVQLMGIDLGTRFHDVGIEHGYLTGR